MIQIDIKKDVIPVRVGEVEFEFEATRENVAKLFDIYDNPEKFEKSLKTKFKKEVAELENDENSKVSKFSRMSDLEVKIARESFDLLLGKGSFNKIYKVYSDVGTLLYTVLPQVSESLGLEVGKRFESQIKDQEKFKKKYLKEKRKNK
ncbi:MAG: hypothetical protein FWF42_00200 [Streptococcaceae bacterium]|nr:hypothetical protein [Streptococcaceae bacterium]MCL2680899.1 hypothetical protein [Streptococcaceae bacterium]MCL2858095.1 hypothetical protein [Streptococcaceae bacterium]